MGTISKRENGKVQAQVCVNGIRESATFATLGYARQWIAERERALENAPQGSQKPLREALERYADTVSPTHKGERWERVRLRKLALDPMASIPLAALAGPDIAEWRDRRLAIVQPASVRREMALLRSVLQAARLDWGWLKSNPMDEVRKPPMAKHRDRRITDDEIRRLCIAMTYTGLEPVTATQRVAVAFLLAIETAMRSGELLGLTWDRLHLKECYAQLIETKNGHARKVPLSSEAVRLFKLLPKTGETVLDIQAGTRDAIFRKAREAAQIKDLHFHDARHEAITRLARKIDVLDLARMTGHSNINELRTYYNMSASDIAKRLG